MNRVFVLILCVPILVAGCILDDASQDDQLSTVHSYSPDLSGGAGVAWNMTVTDPDGNILDTIDYHRYISEYGSDDEHAVYRMSTDIPEISPARFYVDQNAIWFYVDAGFFDNLILGSMQNTPLGYAYPLFDFSAKYGIKHTIMEGGTTTEDLYVNFNVYSTRTAGDETLSVPMGTFRECQKFQLKYSVIYTPRVQGDIHQFDRIETYWFGKNVGPVKEIIEYYQNNVLVRQAVLTAVGNQSAPE